jgi:hypothetical protein
MGTDPNDSTILHSFVSSISERGKEKNETELLFKLLR